MLQRAALFCWLVAQFLVQPFSQKARTHHAIAIRALS
jgi:hypothetical protein